MFEHYRQQRPCRCGMCVKHVRFFKAPSSCTSRSAQRQRPDSSATEQTFFCCVWEIKTSSDVSLCLWTPLVSALWDGDSKPKRLLECFVQKLTEEWDAALCPENRALTSETDYAKLPQTVQAGNEQLREYLLTTGPLRSSLTLVKGWVQHFRKETESAPLKLAMIHTL